MARPRACEPRTGSPARQRELGRKRLIRSGLVRVAYVPSEPYVANSRWISVPDEPPVGAGEHGLILRVFAK